MKTLTFTDSELFLKHPIMTIILVMMLIGMAIIIAAYALGNFKAGKFEQDSIFLREMIKRLPVNFESRKVILDAYDNLDCTTDSDIRIKRSIKTGIDYKFRNFNLDDDEEEFSPEYLNFEKHLKEYQAVTEAKAVSEANIAKAV